MQPPRPIIRMDHLRLYEWGSGCLLSGVVVAFFHEPFCAFMSGSPCRICDLSCVEQELMMRLLMLGSRTSAVIQIVSKRSRASKLSLQNLQSLALLCAWGLPLSTLSTVSSLSFRSSSRSSSSSRLKVLLANRKPATLCRCYKFVISGSARQCFRTRERERERERQCALPHYIFRQCLSTALAHYIYI